MNSSLILKLSVVSESGIGVAEQPRVKDEGAVQLAAGLTAAILAFSKDVHKAELERLSFFDRTITFIPFGNVFILAEISSKATEKLISGIADQIVESLDPSLAHFDNTMSYMEKAEKALKELISKNWVDETLDDLGYDKPFANQEIRVVSLKENENKFEFIVGDDLGCINALSEFMEKVASVKNESKNVITAFLPIVEDGDEKSHYIVAKFNKQKVDLALFHVDSEASNTLFRLTPLLDFVVNSEVANNPNLTVSEILEIVKNTHDIADEAHVTNNADTISVGFIDRTLKKRIDQALLPMMTGKSVIVTGDKPTVRIVTNTLQLFGQHMAMDVIEWLDEGDTIARSLTGMSENKFRAIQSKLITDYVHIDIDKGKINNGKSNKYISNWFKDVKKFELHEGNKYIVRTLNHLVSTALGITKLTALPKDQAVDELLKLKKEINDKDKFAIVSNLASQRNPLLESMIEELSSAIKSAEDYFSNF